MRPATLAMAIVLLAPGTIQAEDWVIGADDPNEVVTQTADRTVDGNVIILNNGRLNVDGATITMLGNIYVLNTATLNVNGGSIRFVQAYRYQRELVGTAAAAIQLVDAVVEGSGHAYMVGLTGSAAAEFERVTVENGFATWGLFDDATLVMTDCTNGGEFGPAGTNAVTISGTDTLLFWMTLPDGSVVDVALPPPGNVGFWSISPDSPWASGIPYSVTLSDCTNVFWGVMAQSGCDGTFRDSAMQVVGSYFVRSNNITLSGIANHAVLDDTSYEWGDVALRFVNCSVETWNYYCLGTTQLTLANCLFGELLVEGNGEATVVQSMCDGSGGYMGAGDSGELWLFSSTNLSQTTSSGQATFIACNSALLSPFIDAADSSTMGLFNTEYVGEPAAHHGATIFDLAIDPVEAASGDVVSLRGTARLVTGPTSPHTFDSYTLEYGVGDEPNEWITIDGPFDKQVRDATLGTWNTCGLPPGAYAIQVSLFHGFPDPVNVASSASLADGSFAQGDSDCDGDVDLDDFDRLGACMTGPDAEPAAPECGVFDFEPDSDIDLHDFAVFQRAFTGGDD